MIKLVVNLKKISKIVFTSFLILCSNISFLFAGDYCVGIRANGELIPAHWMAMARIIENKGMPSMTSGGSSASITQFLLDGISRNKMFSENINLEQSLLLKSLVPHIAYIINEDANAPNMINIAGGIVKFAKGGFIQKIKSALLTTKNSRRFFNILGNYGPLLNPEIAHGLTTNFKFYKAQLQEAMRVFGKFDAQNDNNIFYRSGIIDFKFLGILLGRVADFYAGHGSTRVNSKLKKFMFECAPESFGKDWVQINSAKPQCKELLVNALVAYYAAPLIEKRVRRPNGRGTYLKRFRGKRTFPNKMIFEKVGSGLNAFPGTSVILGDAVKKYQNLSQQYKKKRAIGISDFTIDFNKEAKFGYWGRSTDLKRIGQNLKTEFKDDLKSQKFMPLEAGSWFEVLATSPAEPGLSNLQYIPDGKNIIPRKIINKRYFFKKKWRILPSLRVIQWHNTQRPSNGILTYRAGMISAGGWSDLHPTIILKANKCSDIVYVTRQGGDSVFGQQLFIRLLGDTEKISFWKDIAHNNRLGWTGLSRDEENSPWNKISNLGNPNSSFNRSIAVANAVYCTNWDSFNIFKNEISPLEIDAYNSPVFIRDNSDRKNYKFGYNRGTQSQDDFPGCKTSSLY